MSGFFQVIIDIIMEIVTMVADIFGVTMGSSIENEGTRHDHDRDHHDY